LTENLISLLFSICVLFMVVILFAAFFTTASFIELLLELSGGEFIGYVTSDCSLNLVEFSQAIESHYTLYVLLSLLPCCFTLLMQLVFSEHI